MVPHPSDFWDVKIYNVSIVFGQIFLWYTFVSNFPFSCPRMDISNTITSMDGTSYKIQGKFTCQSRYIVYVMTCSTCSKQYVGETSQTLNKRFRTHESVIRINSENNIAEHFNLPNHSPISYTVSIVSQEEDKNRRLRLEESWIHLLNTFQPNGLNLKL